MRRARRRRSLEHKVGDKVTFTVQRDKETKDIVGHAGSVRPRRQGRRRRRSYLRLAGGEASSGGLRMARDRRRTAPPTRPASRPTTCIADDRQERGQGRQRQILERLRDRKAGDKVTLKVQRGTRRRTSSSRWRFRRRPAGRPRADDRPYSFMYGGQRENVAEPAGAGRLRSTAASTSPPTAAKPGRASTASTRGRCTSARSASIPATTSTSTSWASPCTAPATAARPSSRRRRQRRPRRPARPVDRPERRPAHARRLRRRLLRHLRPHGPLGLPQPHGHRPVLPRRRG